MLTQFAWLPDKLPTIDDAKDRLWCPSAPRRAVKYTQSIWFSKVINDWYEIKYPTTFILQILCKQIKFRYNLLRDKYKIKRAITHSG